MNPGRPQLLICPFCREEKKVLTLLSGNTCHGRQWSDTRSIYPMLPSVSPIQKCPSCGMYYFSDEVESRISDKKEDVCLETGDLTYEELKEAAIQFGSTLSMSEWYILDLYLLWAYNDKYNREDMDLSVASKEEQNYINRVLDDLRVMSQADDVIKAEFLRERGRFEDALALLDKCHPEEDFLVDIVERMKIYAKENNPIAFII